MNTGPAEGPRDRGGVVLALATPQDAQREKQQGAHKREKASRKDRINGVGVGEEGADGRQALLSV